MPSFTRVRDGKEHVVPGYERKRPKPRWTEEAIVAAMQKWTDMYGDPPAMVDWNPVMARLRGEPQRQARYLGGVWPSAATVARHFGSWGAAIQAAGLEAHRSGPRSDLVVDPKKLSSAAGEDGEATLKDLLCVPPDFTPFGLMRRMMEMNVENTKDKTRVRRRMTGWRISERARESTSRQQRRAA